ncbi:MAG: acylphosphatase [Actinomycetota bacterium]
MHEVVRRDIRVQGTVQGVGFRPYVHALAVGLGLGGRVGNDARGVFIEVEGHVGPVQDFVDRLPREAPPLASIEAVEVTDAAPRGERSFQIVASPPGGQRRTLIPPDVATCEDCLAEVLDPSDRRAGYAFTNCTNCGPRYSIVTDVPYDRPNTTMAGFQLCAACRAEYEDPTDRRFHAQPTCCPDCGPSLSFERLDGTPIEGEPIATAAGWQPPDVPG